VTPSPSASGAGASVTVPLEVANTGLDALNLTVLQLAGDLLPDSSDENKIASGYNRVLQTSHEGGVQQQEYQHKYDADRVRNISAVWLGASAHHLRPGSTLSAELDTYVATLCDIARSLLDDGYLRLLFLNGSGSSMA
jgi:hypothetical protein